MHDIGRNVLRRKVECEFRECRFSFSHVAPPISLPFLTTK
jgi:hypothetical protein